MTLDHGCAIQRAWVAVELADRCCVRDSLQFDPRYSAGQDALDALQRIVDRIDPIYRT